MTDQPLEPIHHVYDGFDRKACLVQLDDGEWVDAEIRGRDRDAEGRWAAHVMWSHGPGKGNHLGRFAHLQRWHVRGASQRASATPA